jgi:hypothetical protein
LRLFGSWFLRFLLKHSPERRNHSAEEG